MYARDLAIWYANTWKLFKISMHPQVTRLVFSLHREFLDGAATRYVTLRVVVSESIEDDKGHSRRDIGISVTFLWIEYTPLAPFAIKRTAASPENEWTYVACRAFAWTPSSRLDSCKRIVRAAIRYFHALPALVHGGWRRASGRYAPPSRFLLL